MKLKIPFLMALALSALTSAAPASAGPVSGFLGSLDVGWRDGTSVVRELSGRDWNRTDFEVDLKTDWDRSR